MIIVIWFAWIWCHYIVHVECEGLTKIMMMIMMTTLVHVEDSNLCYFGFYI